ncbi:MAG: hypothetical protein AB1938_17140 [Myxococcota bacterium]
MNALWMLVVLAQVPVEPKPECRTSGMNVACGFDCRAELDEVKCAQTPQGFCQRLERQLVCWDPPEEVRLHAPRLGRPACRAKFRDLACGYACVTSPNHLACAQTPWGVCATRFDRVECWDPSPAVIHHSKPEELTGARCVQTDVKFACGWDCKRSYQDAQCAQTPKGQCRIVEGRISCFDPPLPPITHEPVATTKR